MQAMTPGEALMQINFMQNKIFMIEQLCWQARKQLATLEEKYQEKEFNELMEKIN